VTGDGVEQKDWGDLRQVILLLSLGVNRENQSSKRSQTKEAKESGGEGLQGEGLKKEKSPAFCQGRWGGPTNVWLDLPSGRTRRWKVGGFSRKSAGEKLAEKRKE